MTILHIAYYTAKRNLIDKRGIFKIAFFPLILILILGYSLKTLYISPSIGPDNVSVYCSDSKVFEQFKSYINGNDLYKNAIILTKVKSREAGIKAVSEGKDLAFIDLSKEKSKYTEIKDVYIFNQDDSDIPLIKEVVNSFQNNTNVQKKDTNGDNYIEHVPIELSSRKPNAIGYYSVTMIVMMMLYCSRYGITIMTEDEDKMGRIKSFPIMDIEHIIGKMLGCVFVVYIEAMFMVIFTKYIYKVNWGNNILNIMVIMLLYSFLLLF